MASNRRGLVGSRVEMREERERKKGKGELTEKGKK